MLLCMVTGNSTHGLSLFETPFFPGSVSWQNLPSESAWEFFGRPFLPLLAVNYIVFWFITCSSSLSEDLLECFFYPLVIQEVFARFECLYRSVLQPGFPSCMHIYLRLHTFLGSNPRGKPFSCVVHVFWHLQSEVFKDRDFEQLVVLYLIEKEI